MGRIRSLSFCLIAAACSALGGGAAAGEKHVGEDLSQQNFAGKPLEEAIFEDCVLNRASFERAMLAKAVFKGSDLTDANLSFADCTEADLRGATFDKTSLYKTDFSQANFEGCDLSRSTLAYTKFKKADLRNLKALGATTSTDFSGADLRGANLVGMVATGSEIFKGAKYDKKTKWPKGINPEAVGAVLDESGVESPAKPEDLAKQLSKEFAKLDANEDGRLSGSEMKGLEAYDADKNGRITFEEFVDGKSKKE